MNPPHLTTHPTPQQPAVGCRKKSRPLPGVWPCVGCSSFPLRACQGRIWSGPGGAAPPTPDSSAAGREVVGHHRGRGVGWGGERAAIGRPPTKHPPLCFPQGTNLRAGGGGKMWGGHDGGARQGQRRAFTGFKGEAPQKTMPKWQGGPTADEIVPRKTGTHEGVSILIPSIASLKLLLFCSLDCCVWVGKKTNEVARAEKKQKKTRGGGGGGGVGTPRGGLLWGFSEKLADWGASLLVELR